MHTPINKIKVKTLNCFLLLAASILLLNSCKDAGGYLVGVQGRYNFYQPIPYGMLFIPPGSYNMGASDQDVPYAQINQSKTVSLQAFYMDETEITNNEYRQFVYWVVDSIAHRLLGNAGMEDHQISQDDFGNDIVPPLLNWDENIRWNGDNEREALNEMFLPEHERFYRHKEIDTRKLNYEYYRIDLIGAAKKELYDDDGVKKNGRPQGLKDRSVFIKKDIVNVYPDTLAWVHDFTYSFNEPMTEKYFWHPAYDNYPLVGVNWKQARAFCIWRTQFLNNYLTSRGEWEVNNFRLPTESEWEYAARGGLDLSPYPWGGPYIRNSNGCFLGNYKPLRGNYTDDGGLHTVVVAHYAPNDYGLYDMAGNVAEWTNNAFEASTYNFAHDLNMDYQYEAKNTDPDVLKRKVTRGGSWKDIGYYIQVSSRNYEYQDSSKCYLGFRCVQTYLGRAIGDSPNASNAYD